MIAIRKNHAKPPEGRYRGDLFEIVLIQVKGGNAKFPSPQEMQRLREVKSYQNADEVVLVEWKKGQKLCCYRASDITTEVSASEIFGKVPSSKRLVKEVLGAPLSV